MLCPITQADCENLLCPTEYCVLGKGVGYSQVPADEQLQADTMEAHSLKYHHCAQIFQLSSGHFALIGHFTNDSGLPLLAIGTWQELEEHVKEYRQLADARAPTQHRPAKMKASAADYSDLFGDDQ